MGLDGDTLADSREVEEVVQYVVDVTKCLEKWMWSSEENQCCVVGLGLSANLMSSHTCHTSSDCHSTTSVCCRDANGQVLAHSEGGFGGLFPGGTHGTGTCSDVLAKEGEVCDSNCKCGTGFECYRQMSGVCCPPMRCYNATWVQQQKHYWSNCISDPKCFLPPRK